VAIAMLIVNYAVPNIMYASDFWQLLVRTLIYSVVAGLFYGVYYFVVERNIIFKRRIKHENQKDRENS
jgi:hypothetical protein